MFLKFFLKLKESRIPVSLGEFLTFLSALKSSSILYNFDNFYFLAKLTLVKEEKFLNIFDKIFENYFKSVDAIELKYIVKFLKIPDHWFEQIFERHFSREEVKKIKSLGSFDELIKELQKRINEQKKKTYRGK